MPTTRRKAQSWPYPRQEGFVSALRTSSADWFAQRGCPVNDRMPYLLLDHKDWPSNIILPEVTSYIKQEHQRRSQARAGFPLHKYLHHGLSSQAMLFNLVGPLVAAESLAPLQAAFQAVGVQWPSGTVVPIFELEDRRIFNEDSGQPTSIDLVIQGSDGSRSLYVEAKLVEAQCGGCSVFQKGDCEGRSPANNLSRCYLHYIGRSYWGLLEKHGFLAGPAGSSPFCPLAVYYQFFRELLFALVSGGDFVLLFDERNPAFFSGDRHGERGLMPFLATFVPPELKSKLHSVSIQEILASYRRFAELTWLDEFEKKYGLSI
jgi:hypothetical protein